MSTGKQSAVHAQQNSDGTFELHVEPSEGGEYDFDGEVHRDPPPAVASRKIPIRLMGAVVLGVIVVGGLVYSLASFRSSSIDTELALEPVAGFKPYMTGAGAPSVKARKRASIPEPQEIEELEGIREEESPSLPPGIEVEPQSIEEQTEVPLPPPPELMQRPEEIEESEIAPEESGWQVDEPEAAPDEQSNLLHRGPQRSRIESFRNGASLMQPSVPLEDFGRGRRTFSAKSLHALGSGGPGLSRGLPEGTVDGE